MPGRTRPGAPDYCFWLPEVPPEAPPLEPLVDPPDDDFSPPCARPVSAFPPPDFVVVCPVLPGLVVDFVLAPVLVLVEPRTEVPPRVVVREWIDVRLPWRSSTPTPT